MNHFNNVRELIWPLLEGLPIKDVNRNFSTNDINVAGENLEKILDAAIKESESEDERAKLIDSKSSLFIGTIGVITSIIIAVTTVLVKESFQSSIFFLVLLLFILTLYMARTVWFSIKVLERRIYHTIDTDDYLMNEIGDEYLKNLIVKILNKIRANSGVINSKVDYMVMAQEYFKRAIIVVIIYSFVICIFYVSKSSLKMDFDWQLITIFFNNLTLNGWNTLIIYILIATSLFISLKSLYKKRKPL